MANNSIEERADKYFQEQYPNGRMVGSAKQVFDDALNDYKAGYTACNEDVVKVIEAEIKRCQSHLQSEVIGIGKIVYEIKIETFNALLTKLKKQTDGTK